MRRSDGVATMWPRLLPPWITSDPRRRAEMEVYGKLKGTLDEEWTVFYSRPWWGIGPGGGEIDGEADFIVAHPDRGLLFLEVKGGGVSFSAETGSWQTKDRNGITHSIRDPAIQAMSCKHRYLDRLRALEGWPGGRIRFRHGVVFPDSSAPAEDGVSPAGHDLRLFCFSGMFEHSFRNWILGRLEPHQAAGGEEERGPGKTGIGLLERLVAAPVRLRVPLGREVRGDLDALDQLLTGAQLALAALLEAAERALIEGGAGTGKTILAGEMAARCSEKGKSVLYCCRSVPLAREMARRMAGRDGVSVRSCRVPADLLSSAAERGEPSASGSTGWDVIIVDEAQDFPPAWWDPIETLVTAGHSRLLVFADSNQAVYCLREDLAACLELERFRLGVNLRSTRNIARVTERLYRGPLIRSCGPEGVAPVAVDCTYGEAVSLAAGKTLELIREENISPSDIAVLVPDGECAGKVCSLLSDSGLDVTDAGSLLPGAVTVDTVRQFKGLESPVIILVTDGLLARNAELLYVGLSRARGFLCVFGPVDRTLLDMALAGRSTAEDIPGTGDVLSASRDRLSCRKGNQV